VNSQLTPFEKATEYYKTSNNPRVETRIFLTSILGMQAENVDAAIAEIEQSLCVTAVETISPSPVARVTERVDEASFVDPMPDVPASLKELRQWLRWKLEPNKDGDLTKVPYQVNGDKASSTNPNTWTDYQTAVSGVIITNTQGVGFVVDGGIVGIDLDGCRDANTGDLTEWAQRIVDALDSYTEITPSQTGVRVWITGELPESTKVFNLDPACGYGGKVKIEVYTDSRYFTVTGDAYFDGPAIVEKRDLKDAYKLFHEIRNQYPLQRTQTAAASSGGGQFVEIEKLGFVEPNKLDIFTNGNIESQKPFVISDGIGRLHYESQSEADMAFATVLAIHHDCDQEKVSQDFRASKLYRSKWDRLEDQTITKAIATATKLKEERAQQQSQLPVDPDTSGPNHTLSDEDYESEMEKEFPVIPLRSAAGPTWDDDIMHGVAGDIVRKAAEYCEAHPAGMYLDLLASFGSIVGRGPYFNVSSTQHRANEFIVRVGDSSISRKGTGRDAVNEVLKLVDPNWYQNRVMSGFGSAEAIVNELRDESTQQVRDRKGGFKSILVPGVPDKRLMIREGELASIFQLAGKPESRADVVLRDGWDGHPLRNLVKGKSDGLSNSNSCQFPHISISADTTRTELIAKLPDGAAENGFGNRFLYCYVRRVKMCPNGGPRIDWTNELIALRRAIEFARDLEYVGVQKSTWKVWNRMYPEIENDVQRMPGLAGAMCARAVAHVRRLALILCLLDSHDTIETKHLHAAKQIWDYCQDSTRFIFSGTTADQDRILRWLQKSGAVTIPQIRRGVFHDHRPAEWVRMQINGLIQGGKLFQQGDVIAIKP
jgi:hypothetical protein